VTLALPVNGALNAAGVSERWAHWPRQTESPYYPLFYGAMRPHGVAAVATLELTTEWLAAREADAIHVHWPDGLWRQGGKGLLARLRGVRQMRSFLTAAKQYGVKLIWTVHNARPHEGGDRVDARGYATLASLADLIICHSNWSAEEIRETYRPMGNVLVMPHGSFEAIYPATRSRESVLAELGLDPVRPVVSCLGYLRAYKGLEIACEAARRLAGQVQLVIGGPVFRKFDLGPIHTSIARLANARLLARRLTDQEFADLTAASDATLLPYSNVTTSGALVASWSLGTGVVASDLPYFREMIPKPTAAGRLFRAGDVNSLAAAIEEYLRVPREIRSAAALAEARNYSWSSCVEPVADWIAQDRLGHRERSFASLHL
jgi:beta-1,4-mannosyltransferase